MKPHTLCVLALVALAATPLGEAVETVPPGKVYSGEIIRIAAPVSEGWMLGHSDSSAMIFLRRGNDRGESFAATVTMFDPPQADAPEEFEALIVQGFKEESDPARFSEIEMTHQFTTVRGYPCVQIYGVSEDREARTGVRRKETLLLQLEGLYCRHPVQRTLGFAVAYSHRGKALHPGFHDEARSFIEGVQVPGHPAPD